MSTEESRENGEHCEEFFKSLDPGLTQFFGMTESDVSDEELDYSFPIMSELTAIDKLYEELEVVGQGGMKQIHRVLDLKSNRYVAMARIEPVEDAASREKVEYFLREARLTSSLQHPNIVTVHDIGLDQNSNPFFTMELLNGMTLAEVVQDEYGRNSEGCKQGRDRLVSIFSSVCDAIAYAHSKQVIHLDIKPQNVHVGEFGEVIVMDWGLAKILTVDDDLEQSEQIDPNELNHATLQGVIKGTPGFMAPEQAQSYGSKDTRSDVYALGAILYMCLSGKPPIDGGTVEERLQRTKQGDIPMLSSVVQGKPIDLGLEALVMKALELDPNDRYASVSELKTDLEKYRQGFATSAEDASFFTQTVLLLKRHRMIVSILAACIALIIGTVLVAFSSINKEKHDAIVARQQAEANLALLKKEKNVSESLRENVDSLVTEVLESDDVNSAKRKIALLEQAIHRESDKAALMALWKRKAVLHFVIQEFEDTMISLMAASSNYRKLQYFRWAKLGSELKGGSEYLSDDGLAELFSNMGANHAEVIFGMYANHMEFYRDKDIPPEEYVKLATVMLNMNNRIWNTARHTEWIEFNDGKLNLSGRKYRNLCNRYGQGLNILKPFTLNSIDLSDTMFFEFYQLRGLSVEEINLAGCSVNKINEARCQMLKRSGVKNVIYDSSMLGEKEVELLNKNFKVTDISDVP